MRVWRYRLCWWIAQKLPKQIALYAFVRVHGLTGEGPAYDGEYHTAYKLWAKTYGIEE